MIPALLAKVEYDQCISNISIFVISIVFESLEVKLQHSRQPYSISFSVSEGESFYFISPVQIHLFPAVFLKLFYHMKVLWGYFMG